VRYTPIGGRIGVRVEPKAADGIRLVVENSGPEIPPADLAHLFEPFYRVDPARTRENNGGAGPGLGLAMVAAIARLHNGTAHATSDKRGTRFEVDLLTPTSP
jgi:two-component system heavy metal sensor histidine kinase CusS